MAEVLHPIYGLVVLMLLVVLLAGAAAGGAQRWVDIGPVQVQPSEFVKLMMVVVLACHFAERSVAEHVIFLRAMDVLAVPAFLVYLQPDLGTALVFGAVFVVMAYVAGARPIQFAGLVAAAAVSAMLAVKLRIIEPYQVTCLMWFMNPEGDDTVGYQVAQSKVTIGPEGRPARGSLP